ncbi:MAG: SDR family oxidoreductase [Pseudomonadales bacterium]|jgi:NAD(P)-dependent dehydrogenase (short-subunit alcohol dehydrogenase family)|tara:strand:+ start:1512 stop:2318 length:807 start_codon:yes stop_codon:yes gene_type:complete
MDINEKLAVVTGAGSGIGRALASRLVDAGARFVICTDLDGAAARETADLIGAKASGAVLDVADQAAIEDLVTRVEAAHGGIDIFVSNAGYALGGGLGLDTDQWRKMMEVHLWAHLNAARAVVPGMIARGGGYLLNTASAAGLLTQLDSGPYAVSKHAAVALAEWLAINYSDQGIGVSVLCPQAVRTNILGKPSGKSVAKRSNSSQAAQDGILEPEQVADDCIEAIVAEQFLVLPHKEVAKYFANKANDYERWLSGMRRFRDRLRQKRK